MTVCSVHIEQFNCGKLTVIKSLKDYLIERIASFSTISLSEFDPRKLFENYRFLSPNEFEQYVQTICDQNLLGLKFALISQFF